MELKMMALKGKNRTAVKKALKAKNRVIKKAAK
jgi:hypothetical protein